MGIGNWELGFRRHAARILALLGLVLLTSASCFGATRPSRLVLVVAQSNDWYGYVVTPQDYDTGGYETCMSLYGRDFAPLYEQQFKMMVDGDPTGATPAGADCGCGK